MKTIILVLISLFSIAAFATPAQRNAMKTQYPGKAISCKTCHDQTPKLNPYGYDFEKANHDFKAIEGLDSDGDEAINLDEINANTAPGDKGSKP